MFIGCRPSAIGSRPCPGARYRARWLPAIGRSAVSHRLSAIGSQPSARSRRPRGAPPMAD